MRLQSVRSEVTLADPDSDSDNFSVEFEVESIASDDYNEDDASVSADDQVTNIEFLFPEASCSIFTSFPRSLLIQSLDN